LNSPFLNQTEDNTTNLTYLNARYYDPTLTRFLSVDPISVPVRPQSPICHSGVCRASYP